MFVTADFVIISTKAEVEYSLKVLVGLASAGLLSVSVVLETLRGPQELVDVVARVAARARNEFRGAAGFRVAAGAQAARA